MVDIPWPMVDEWYSHVAPRLVAEYELARAESRLDADTPVTILLIGGEEVALDGLALGTRAGDVVIATATFRILPALAGHPAVAYVEPSTSLGWDVALPSV
jgi:hypothetical protein